MYNSKTFIQVRETEVTVHGTVIQCRLGKSVKIVPRRMLANLDMSVQWCGLESVNFMVGWSISILTLTVHVKYQGVMFEKHGKT